MRHWMLLLLAVVYLGAAGCNPQSPDSGLESAPDTHAKADPHAGHDHGPGEGHDHEHKDGDHAGEKAPGADKAAGGSGLAPGKGPWQHLPDAKYRKTASGLVYGVIKEGSGPAITAGKTAVMHYTGWLKSNGEKFDSSRDRGQPFPFPLGAGAVIKGWDEGVAGMKVGEQRQLVIPSDLGYGPSGNGPIPGGATLIFDVQLMEIQ